MCEGTCAGTCGGTYGGVYGGMCGGGMLEACVDVEACAEAREQCYGVSFSTIFTWVLET